MDKNQTQGRMELTSPAFKSGGNIHEKYTCKGRNISPPLAISKVPSSATSLALIVHDPDAVSGDFLHWMMWNIDRATVSIAENSVPPNAIIGHNDAGREDYMGPCPPSGTGTHHYVFELYALDMDPELGAVASRQQLEKQMQTHIVAKCTLTGLVDAG